MIRWAEREGEGISFDRFFPLFLLIWMGHHGEWMASFKKPGDEKEKEKRPRLIKIG